MTTKVLLADDKPTIAKIIGLALPKEEYVLDSVTNGRDLLSKLEKDLPFVILLDIALPYSNDGTNADRDGFYLTQYIKKHPTYRKIKIILLTNAFAPVSEEKCAEYQADGVLVKPFDPSELRAKLKSLYEPVVSIPPKAKPVVVESKKEESGIELSDAAQELASFFASEIEFNETDEITQETSKPIAADVELSPTAQSLADFFASEIHANANDATASFNKTPIPDTATKAVELDMMNFQQAASEWKSHQPTLETNLSEWQQSDATPSVAINIAVNELDPIPVAKVETKIDNKIQSRFDTGGSNFQFSTDYLQRMGVDSPPVIQGNTSIATIAPVPDSPEVEALVREEARKVCQNIVDKIAWEVIPELAENIIKRELDKVLKALETNPR